MTRRIADLEEQNGILHALLTFIRTSDDETVGQTIAAIRQGATSSELKQILQSLKARSPEALGNAVPGDRNVTLAALPASQFRNDESSPSSATFSLRERTSNIVMPRRVFGVNRLTDIPIYSVPAAPWTSFIDDNDLVSHLVSLYATWEHLFFDGIVLELFIRDMQEQNLASHFCSPFLVNCILATACAYSDFDEVRTRMGQTSTLMALFLEQAQILSIDRPAVRLITVAQGFSILSIATKKQNDEYKSYRFTQHALATCSALISARDEIVTSASSAQMKEEIMHSIESTVCGVVNVCGASLDGWLRPLTVQTSIDALSNPPVSWISVTDIWKPYPVSSETQDSLYGASRKYYASLSRLSYKISQCVSRIRADVEFEADPSRILPNLADLSGQLFSWVNELSVQFRAVGPTLPISAIILR